MRVTWEQGHMQLVAETPADVRDLERIYAARSPQRAPLTVTGCIREGGVMDTVWLHVEWA